MKTLASISGPDLVRVLEEVAVGNGLSMGAVLRAARIDNSYVSRWRRGVSRPSQLVHDRISAALRRLLAKR